MGDRTVLLTRRWSLQASAVMGVDSLVPGLISSIWAARSGVLEMTTVRVGLILLTGCVPLIIATLKGSDKKYSITLVPIREVSWAVVCDKLVSGELDAAHVLCGLLYDLGLSIAGKVQPIAGLVTLNQNG